MKLFFLASITTQIAAECEPDFATKTLAEKYLAIYKMTDKAQKDEHKYKCFKPYETEMENSNYNYRSG